MDEIPSSNEVDSVDAPSEFRSEREGYIGSNFGELLRGGDSFHELIKTSARFFAQHSSSGAADPASWQRLLLEYSLALLRIAGDRPAGGHKELTDPLHEANAMLKNGERYFQEMAENNSNAFWLVDLCNKKRILYVSPCCRHFVGCTQEEIYRNHRRWFSKVHKADRRHVWDCHKNIKNGRLEGHEYRILQPDGSIRWVFNQGWPVFGDGGQTVGMAGVISDISESKQLKEEMIRLGEHDRRHMAVELEEGICQHLAGTSLACRVLYNKLIARSDPAAHDMARVCRLLTSAISETRFLSGVLTSAPAGKEWLIESLDRLAATTSSLFAVSCIFRYGADISIPSPSVANNLYRITKEAVTNALRHGEAGSVRIRLRRKGEKILLSISDNGRGFKPPEHNASGFGLRMMTYRAAELGGQLKVVGGKHGGTVVACSIPLE